MCVSNISPIITTQGPITSWKSVRILDGKFWSRYSPNYREPQKAGTSGQLYCGKDINYVIGKRIYSAFSRWSYGIYCFVNASDAMNQSCFEVPSDHDYAVIVMAIPAGTRIRYAMDSGSNVPAILAEVVDCERLITDTERRIYAANNSRFNSHILIP